MSRHENPTTEAEFEQKLQKLRLKIDLLPAEHRPHLHELADTIARQHRRLRNRKSRNHDAN